MSARKARRAPKPVPIIDLWRRMMPITMWLCGLDPRNAAAKEREEGKLVKAIMDSDDSSIEAIAVKLNVALHFAHDQMIGDMTITSLSAVARPVLSQLPRDLAAALRPFIIGRSSTRCTHETWDAGAAAAFPEVAREVAKATGEAA